MVRYRICNEGNDSNLFINVQLLIQSGKLNMVYEYDNGNVLGEEHISFDTEKKAYKLVADVYKERDSEPIKLFDEYWGNNYKEVYDNKQIIFLMPYIGRCCNTFKMYIYPDTIRQSLMKYLGSRNELLIYKIISNECGMAYYSKITNQLEYFAAPSVRIERVG